jgi:hypothetical protein
VVCRAGIVNRERREKGINRRERRKQRFSQKEAKRDGIAKRKWPGGEESMTSKEGVNASYRLRLRIRRKRVQCHARKNFTGVGDEDNFN